MNDINDRRLAQEVVDWCLESLRMNLDACQQNAKARPADADYWRGAVAQSAEAVDTLVRVAGHYNLRSTPINKSTLTLIDNTKK
jgi:hypothetical protein